MQLAHTKQHTATIHPEKLSLPQGDVVLYRQLFSLQESDRLYGKLMDETDWQSYKIKLFGKAIDQPRLIAFYG
ncbi:MAG: hypothetical protein MI674_05115, partial [Cytophagales bacterium]|nr:hypothetical protein [Cytophagales bacterium]